MRLDLENNSATFVGVRLALTADDLQRVIDQLQSLKASPHQHFHLTADGQSVFVDLDVGVQGEDERSNASITGFAIQPDGT
jgi:hypothetical protein